MDAASSLENEQTIIRWLQENAIPVQHIEAGNGFADLQPLKTILNEVKVVGLGETTHGTREIFQLKHRLLEFLVIEMGFTVFAIEAGFAACQAINDYVLYGKGDRATVLTGQWYVVWDAEEVADMLDWMRAYNQGVPEKKKVKFYGVDINLNENGRQAVLGYLRKVDPDMLAGTELLFEGLGRVEAKWPLRIDEATEKAIVQLLPPLQGLIDHLMVNKDKFASSSSLAEFDQALQYTRIMKQWLMANATALLPQSRSKSAARSVSMAENLIWLVDQAAPDAKLAIWAHNAHIVVGGFAIEEPNMGSYLREKYGQGYFAFGFEFNQGAFQTRLIQEEMLLGDLKQVTLPTASEGTFPWYLSRTNMDALILNLRVPASDFTVRQWIARPQTVHQVRWFYDEELRYYLEVSIAKYDGIIFIDKTTASRATENALKTVANRDGL
jgi:erythromycin esterase